MIMNEANASLHTNIQGAQEFVIEATGNIMDTLSTRMYTNPIRATIRELVSNGIDANLDKGVSDPIKVHLPTRLEPEFFVEDFGIGMDNDTIMNVYTHYGNSTKNGSNDRIGGLGLGSKTPFAYTTQFFVTSAKNGKKNTYICFKNEDNKPAINLVDSEDVDESVTGTKVSFPVKVEDISDFAKEAAVTLLFTMSMPDIISNVDSFLYYANCENMDEYLAAREEARTKTYSNNDKLEYMLRRSSYGDFIAEMGGVAYILDSSEFLSDEGYSILQYIKRKAEVVILHMPIGALSIQSSREGLHYNQRTKDALTRAVISLFMDEAKTILDEDKSEEAAA